ncbi:MAG: NAD-dependent epimerase/dehydratase family protein [Bacteroidota bacterium]|nr:NAD-dependent epimerase/dehydratase family protein [Bacteroidota bacterium]
MILVTGGTGLLGSHLLLGLVREHAEVVALKRPSSDLEEVKRVFGYHCSGEEESAELFGRIRWLHADLLNQAELEEALQDVDRVYHCAAMVSFQPRDRQKMIRFNSRSTASLVNACLNTGVKKLLHVSSTSAIGRSPDGSPATESMIWTHTKTSTGYAVSKFRSEMEVWRGMEEGLNAVIVNPSIILGPGFWERGSSSMFSRVAGGLKYAAPGITGYVGIQDVVEAMIRLMNSDISGERYILSEGDYSYLQVFGMIAESLGVPRNLKKVTPSLLQKLMRLDSFAALFRGIRLITSEHVRAAFGEVHFSSEKVKKAIDMEFTPLEQVIGQVAEHYRQDHP